MRFNPKARLDTSRVRDVGGSSGGGGAGGGGMRIPIPGGTKAGGGIGGILIVILFLVLTQCMNNGGTGGVALPDTGTDTSRMAGTDTGRYANCKTGADTVDNPDCVRVAVENSLYNYWSEALPEQSDVAVPAGGHADLHRRHEHRLRQRHGRGRPLLLPRRRHHLPRHHVLRAGPPAAAQRSLRGVRRAVRAGPRVRAPHPEPAGHHGPGTDPAGTQQRRRPAGAAGRLLRRHVGQERHEHRHAPTASRCCSTSPTRTSSRRSRRPRPWATTGSSSRPRAGSTRSSGPTAPPRPG